MGGQWLTCMAPDRPLATDSFQTWGGKNNAKVFFKKNIFFFSQSTDGIISGLIGSKSICELQPPMTKLHHVSPFLSSTPTGSHIFISPVASHDFKVVPSDK